MCVRRAEVAPLGQQPRHPDSIDIQEARARLWGHFRSDVSPVALASISLPTRLALRIMFFGLSVEFVYRFQLEIAATTSMDGWRSESTLTSGSAQSLQHYTGNRLSNRGMAAPTPLPYFVLYAHPVKQHKGRETSFFLALHGKTFTIFSKQWCYERGLTWCILESRLSTPVEWQRSRCFLRNRSM